MSWDSFTHLKDIELSDRHTGSPRSIDLLLGAEHFPYLLKNEKRFGSSLEPVALSKFFDWTVMRFYSSNKSTPSVNFLQTIEHLLNLIVARVRELESVPEESTFFTGELQNNIIKRLSIEMKMVDLLFSYLL